jgi:uncharacterized membrane-anchored protein
MGVVLALGVLVAAVATAFAADRASGRLRLVLFGALAAVAVLTVLAFFAQFAGDEGSPRPALYWYVMGAYVGGFLTSLGLALWALLRRRRG